LGGLLVGTFISVLTSKLQAGRELDRLERILKSNYEQKLIEERLNVYPKLWKTVSLLNKSTLRIKFKESRIDEHLRFVLSELNGWYEDNGLTLSKDAYGRFTRLCSSIDSHLKADVLNNEAALKGLRRRVWQLRQNLRADVQLERIAPRQAAIEPEEPD